MILIQWGRKPPPVGGVSLTVARIDEYLLRCGVRSHVVDLKGARLPPAALMSLWKGSTIHLFHVSRVAALPQAAALARLLRGRRILFLHAPDEPGKEGRKLSLVSSLVPFQGAWVTNTALRDRLVEAGFSNVSIASPYVPLGAPRPRRQPPADGQLRIVTAAYQNSDIYNVHMVVEAYKKVAGRGLARRLDIILYGSSGADDEAAGGDGIVVHGEMKSEAVRELLLQADVYLRMTTTDGDSLLVREALDAGCRVIASDVAPRPEGVELVELELSALERALEHGGAPSTGEGLGVPVQRLLHAELGLR